jgi:uncharacterized protein (TIGR03435 family)
MRQAGFAALLFAVASGAWAQSFEVASVKRNVSGDGRTIFQGLQPGGRFVATNVPLRQLILRAYRLQEVQLTGAPGWIDNERYDIVALAPGATTADEITPRLQNLLKDRFQLAAHMDKKEISVYALVPARKDGKLGPKIQPSTADCPAGRGGGGPPSGPPSGPPARGASPIGERPVCGMRMAPFALLAGGTPMSAFANALSQLTRRIVTDRTGLAGLYDAELLWTPEESPFIGPPPPGAPEFPPGYDPNGPPLTTAIQEQWGLKLENQKGMVDVLVIERIERPTEN